VARFDGGDITSDAGSMLLRAADDRIRLLDRFAGCFSDHRDPRRVEHTVAELARQRVFGLALGYEDLVDHDDLRRDPLLASLVGKRDPKGAHRGARDRGHGLAGSRTLNRLELSTPEAASDDRYRRISLDHDAVDQLFMDVFIESHKRAPKRIVLDLDATDDTLHGMQEGRFFHGYYDSYCYLPLYIFCGEFLLCARLRPSNIDGAKGSVDELTRIVARIRQRWPKTRILVRGDSGFCRNAIMAWCEAQDGVDYLFGLAKNDRLNRRIADSLRRVAKECKKSGKPAREFRELCYKPRKKGAWSRTRRVVAKAEHLPGRSNPRFVVTSLSSSEVAAQDLYEVDYCIRGEMENRIKEQQLYLFADRTSSATMRANQIRLYFSSIAYVLMQSLRRIGLDGTEHERAQCSTIRLKLIKIGARITITHRKVWVSMSSSCPHADLFAQVYANIRARAG
jgi:hypothetical protein